LKRNLAIVLIAVAFLAGTITSGGFVYASFDNCEDPLPKGKPFLEIWEAICDLQDQINALDTRVTDLENNFLDPTPNCLGNAGCIAGYVTQHIDGDTLKVYGKSIRLVLVDAPESNEPGYAEASNFIANTCPVDSFVVVDEDDLQTEGSFGRIIGVVHCNGVNLNEAILDSGLADLFASFCSSSEFENSAWAQRHGCVPSCDPSYPDVCIPSPPPDLDCGDIPHQNFTVLPPDPHGFDGDEDGIGCES